MSTCAYSLASACFGSCKNHVGAEATEREEEHEEEHDAAAAAALAAAAGAAGAGAAGGTSIICVALAARLRNFSTSLNFALFSLVNEVFGQFFSSPAAR